jgi:hypothetical protein
VVGKLGRDNRADALNAAAPTAVSARPARTEVNQLRIGREGISGVVKDKEMGTVLHFRTIRVRSRFRDFGGNIG